MTAQQPGFFGGGEVRPLASTVAAVQEDPALEIALLVEVESTDGPVMSGATVVLDEEVPSVLYGDAISLAAHGQQPVLSPNGAAGVQRAEHLADDLLLGLSPRTDAPQTASMVDAGADLLLADLWDARSQLLGGRPAEERTDAEMLRGLARIRPRGEGQSRAVTRPIGTMATVVLPSEIGVQVPRGLSDLSLAIRSVLRF